MLARKQVNHITGRGGDGGLAPRPLSPSRAVAAAALAAVAGAHDLGHVLGGDARDGHRVVVLATAVDECATGGDRWDSRATAVFMWGVLSLGSYFQGLPPSL